MEPNKIQDIGVKFIKVTSQHSDELKKNTQRDSHCNPPLNNKEPPSTTPVKWPYEYINIYKFPKFSLSCCKKPKIGIICFGGNYSIDNIHLNWDKNGVVDYPTITNKIIAGSLPSFGGDIDGTDELNTFAISVIGSLCPESEIIFYWAELTSTDINYENLEAILDQVAIDKPSIVTSDARMSENYLKGITGGLDFMKRINKSLKKCVQGGTTFTFSTGNNGSSNTIDDTNDLDVMFPASSPWVVACGGTSFIDQDGNYTPNTEYAWSVDPAANGGPSFSTGGGYSSVFHMPCYQKGIVPDNKFRAIPDVALTANPYSGVKFFYNSDDYITGGTSAAAFIFAAFLGRLNRSYVNEKSFNHILYLMYRSGFNICKDITIGTNNTVHNPDLYKAGPGYDLCTGLGSPNGKSFMCALSHFPTA